MSFEFRSVPTTLLRSMAKQATEKLGDEIERVTKADMDFSVALYRSLEIDAELERRGVIP